MPELEGVAMTDNRTAEPTTTEHLRALLDEQGIEWKSGRTNENNTSWDVGDLRITAKELSDGTLLIQQYSRKHFTPEQAIAATLGNDQELIDLAYNAWAMALYAMNGMPIPANWSNSVEQGLRKYGINVD